MRIVAASIVCMLSSSAFAQAQKPELVEAKRQCWQEVGVYGDPYKSRGSSVHLEKVTACVNQKMRSGGGSQGRR